MHVIISLDLAENNYLVREGTTDAQKVKRALIEHVKPELKENCPDRLYHSYFLTIEDIATSPYILSKTRIKVFKV